MPEQDTTQQLSGRTPAPRRRRGPDVLTMLVGVAALFVSTYVLTGNAGWLQSMNPRWAVAGGALLIGVLLLLASLRGDRR